MSDDVKSLIAEAREFADRNNGMNWQGMVRELADALEASVQAPAVDKQVIIRDMQSIQRWWHLSGNDGPADPDYIVDGLIDSGVLQDAAEVEARGLEKAADDLTPGEDKVDDWGIQAGLLRARAQQVREGN